MKMLTSFELRLPAIQVHQGPDRVLYTFAVDGKLLPLFTTVSRVRRNPETRIEGYQRPEVLTHIDEIRRYLESDRPMLPNSLVVAFDTRVRFIPQRNGSPGGTLTCPGTLVIPVNPTLPDSEKPGWVVDGQQRVAAIRDAKIEQFPICVTAFITDNVEEQRSQFILVNSTKPLPKGLVYELLPGASGRLPTALGRRQFPARLLERLNFDPDSPLHRMIQTPTNAGGVVKDNSVLKMLENSLGNGALYRYQNRALGAVDEEGMLRVLKVYWQSVSQVFSDAWALPPRRSRLMHGAGIVSMGFVMDAIAERHQPGDQPDGTLFVSDLCQLKDVCRWTHGTWEFSPGNKRRWNEIQNTPKDIQTLADFLLSEYKKRVWAAPTKRLGGASLPS